MAKEKETPWERPEREKAERMVRFTPQEEKPVSEQPAAKAVPPEVKTTAPEEAAPQEKKSRRKGIAKANGLKSAYLLDEHNCFMTAFGRSSRAMPEKSIVRQNVEDLQKTFTVKTKAPRRFVVSGAAGQAVVTLPKEDANQLHAKAAVETMHFGKTFADNVHVQIAYQIMDIKKLFAEYANMVVHSVDNMRRDHAVQTEDDTPENDQSDLLGTFPTMLSLENANTAYELWKSELLRVENKAYKAKCQFDTPQARELRKLITEHYHISKEAVNEADIENYAKDALKFNKPEHFANAVRNYRSVVKLQEAAQYFPGAFLTAGRFDPNQTFAMMRILGNLRQASFHELNSTATWFFQLDTMADRETHAALNTIVSGRLNSLNKGFVKKNTVNLAILFELFPEIPRSELVNRYYRFIICKDDKNLGFSVKKLRESMLTFPENLDLADPDWNGSRQKLYQLWDFVICQYYRDRPEQADDFVKTLRRTLKGEDKEPLYRKEAHTIWESIRSDVRGTVLENVKSGTNLKDLQNTFIGAKVESIIKPEDISLFAKAMYCICLLLDGKDVNLFLCSLINKLENIASLLDVIKMQPLDNELRTAIQTSQPEQTISELLEKRELPDHLRAEYRMFEDSRKYASQLRIVQALTRMFKSKKSKKTSQDHIKLSTYLDAAAVLGEFDREKVEKDFRLAVRGDKSRKENAIIHGFRNFISNSVINSSRFAYVCRFMDPKDAQIIMGNENLTFFVLKDVPQSQLVRHCINCGIPQSEDCEVMAGKLAKRLKEVNYGYFQSIGFGRVSEKTREECKRLIGLYLTVLFLLVKDLVRVNVNYSMAFGLLERDAAILNVQFSRKFSVSSSGKNTAPYACITDFFAEKKWLNKRVKISIDRNAAYYSDQTFRQYRNAVEHLAVPLKFADYAGEITRPVKSLFDLYHYVMFRYLEDAKNCQFTQAVRDNKISEKVHEYQTVSKDFLYGLNKPLAYNAARYINLSNREQFLAGFGK